MRCIYSKVSLSRSHAFKLYSKESLNSKKKKSDLDKHKILEDHLASLPHKKKKTNEKLVYM